MEGIMDAMWSRRDILLQAAGILISVFMFLYNQNILQKYFPNLFRSRNQPAVADLEAKRHFIKGAQFLSQAQSSKDRSSIPVLAKSAEIEADLAIALNSKDSAAYILKSLALELRGFKTSAIDSLDDALEPEAAKSLSGDERSDALYKRADLKLGLSRPGEIDSAIEDLVESVGLKGDNVLAFCLLGECFKKKGMIEEAKKAFEDALNVEPDYAVALEALDHLSS